MEKTLESDYLEKQLNILSQTVKKLQIDRTKTFTIAELFHVLNKPKEKYTNIHLVNVISAKNNNNGVKNQELSDENTFSGNKIVIVCGGDGGAEMAFYQKLPFKISSIVKVLEPKFDFLTPENGHMIALILSQYKNTYSRSFQWSTDRIKNDTINLPVNEQNIIDFTNYII